MTPTPKGRPRVTRSGHAYTPKKTREAEEEMKWHLLSQWRQKPLTGPVSVILRFYMPIPKSYSAKKRKTLDGTAHIKRPDWDNCAKMVCDSMNGLVIADDSQIWQCTTLKQYSFDPHIEIEIL